MQDKRIIRIKEFRENFNQNSLEATSKGDDD